jgi:predicted acetyltransferase
MDIDVRQASLEEKSVLRHLLELYNYDFSEFDGADLDAHGFYGYGRLDHYWTEPGRYPFLVRADGKLAGLVLVRTLDTPAVPPTRSIAEFFILKKYRRRGVGRAAARRVFDLFPGRWHVSQIANNHPAQAFWRRVIVAYTHGDYQEIWQDDDEWQGPVQTFAARQSP